MARPRGSRQRSSHFAPTQWPREDRFTIANVYAELSRLAQNPQNLRTKADEAYSSALRNLPVASDDDVAGMRWAIEQARRTDRGHEHTWPTGNDPRTKSVLIQYAIENVRDWLRAYHQRYG